MVVVVVVAVAVVEDPASLDGNTQHQSRRGVYRQNVNGGEAPQWRASGWAEVVPLGCAASRARPPSSRSRLFAQHCNRRLSKLIRWSCPSCLRLLMTCSLNFGWSRVFARRSRAGGPTMHTSFLPCAEVQLRCSPVQHRSVMLMGSSRRS